MTDETLNAIPDFDEEATPAPIVPEPAELDTDDDEGLVDDDEGFLDDIDDDESYELPSDDFITVSLSTGAPKFFHTSEPVMVMDIIEGLQLKFQGQYTVFFEGVSVNHSTVIPVGGTIQIVGDQKGG